MRTKNLAWKLKNGFRSFMQSADKTPACGVVTEMGMLPTSAGGLLTNRRAQVLLILGVWCFLCWLHWDNDGLWFYDATQHAAHGVFWKDFLPNLNLKPWDYVMSYFARYPIIRPTRYPPAFYVPMALVYGLMGPSPYYAKFLVLATTLLAALYTMAWCRRWVSPNMGWMGAWLMLLPMVVKWSHAVMLNVPVLAFSIAGLYHFHRWLESPQESPAWRQLYLGAAWAVLSMLTHVTNCVIVLIFVVWLLMARRLRWLLKVRTIGVMVVSALVLLPWFLVVMKYEMGRVHAVVGSTSWISEPLRWHWLFYAQKAPMLFSMHMLGVAGVGVVTGLRIRRWRRETLYLVALTVVCYLFFTYMRWRDVRYVILFALPIVLFSGMAFLGVHQWLSQCLRLAPSRSNWRLGGGVALVLIGQLWLTTQVEVPCVSGYAELVRYMEEVAPDEPLFYEGSRDDIFAFYVLAGDPHYQRQALCGNRFLYARGYRNQIKNFVSSPEDVARLLTEKGGCRWVAVDEVPKRGNIKAAEYLRTAVTGPQFELVKSFPITRRDWREGYEATSVHLYRCLEPVASVDEVEIPFKSGGKIVTHRTKLIAR